MRRLRDLIIEHNCRFKWGELYNDGDIIITEAKNHDPGYFGDGWPMVEEYSDIPEESPVTRPGYEGEVELPVEGGENDTEWFTITFDKTFIRTRKTDKQLIKTVRLIDIKRRLVPTH